MGIKLQGSMNRAFSLNIATENQSNELVGVSEWRKCPLKVQLAYLRGTQWGFSGREALTGPFH